MSYTGYTEGTFSSQIGNYKTQVMSLERQLILLNEKLSQKDQEIKHLRSLLQKYEATSNIDTQNIVSVEQDVSSIKNKTNKKQNK